MFFPGENDEAEGLFHRAIRIAPDHHGVICNYAGFLQSARRDLETAEHFYKQSLILAPDHVPSLCSYSTVMLELHENVPAARNMLKKAYGLMPHVEPIRERLLAVESLLREMEAKEKRPN